MVDKGQLMHRCCASVNRHMKMQHAPIEMTVTSPMYTATLKMKMHTLIVVSVVTTVHRGDQYSPEEDVDHLRGERPYDS